MTRVLLDPTSETQPALRASLPRLASLQGRTVGLLDIAKPRGDIFLDRLEERLRERGAQVDMSFAFYNDIARILG